MHDLTHKVAVVTGAASGIGKALAIRFAKENMKVVIADIEAQLLRDTERELRENGAHVLAVETDVADEQSVRRLAETAVSEFGAVHVICNNAGVGSPNQHVWEGSAADWQWVFSVNMMGIVHGIRVFVPLLMRQNVEAHIVNTASRDGFLAGPFLGIYRASKHAAVSISETLHYELALARSKIKVSILCPGEVQTNIKNSERNRPKHFRNAEVCRADCGLSHGRHEPAVAPQYVAERVVAAIYSGQLYVFTHNGEFPYIQARTAAVTGANNPNGVEARASRIARLQQRG